MLWRDRLSRITAQGQCERSATGGGDYPSMKFADDYLQLNPSAVWVKVGQWNTQ